MSNETIPSKVQPHHVSNVIIGATNDARSQGQDLDVEGLAQIFADPGYDIFNNLDVLEQARQALEIALQVVSRAVQLRMERGESLS